MLNWSNELKYNYLFYQSCQEKKKNIFDLTFKMRSMTGHKQVQRNVIEELHITIRLQRDKTIEITK